MAEVGALGYNVRWRTGGLTSPGGTSVPLEIREGAFRFAGERFLKATGQSLIECAARFGLLAGLELSHTKVKKRIGVERPFPSAFLK